MTKPLVPRQAGLISKGGALFVYDSDATKLEAVVEAADEMRIRAQALMDDVDKHSTGAFLTADDLDESARAYDEARGKVTALAPPKETQ